VHRPQYDDWSLPKGKSKAGEHLLVTATREMTEETGCVPRIGPYLTTVRYRVLTGGRLANKVVAYWSMRCTGGDFRASREVDEMCWLPPVEACRRLTSASDRAVLDAFTRTRWDTEPMVIVRHGATATPAAHRPGRPPAAARLNRTGRDQAAALVPVLAGLGVSALVSADLPVCAEMLAPFAAASGLPVRREVGLTRAGFGAGSPEVVQEVRATARADGAVAVCGQRRVVAGLVDALVRGPDVRPPHDTAVEKGGWWLLHHRGGVVTAYERHGPANDTR